MIPGPPREDLDVSERLSFPGRDSQGVLTPRLGNCVNRHQTTSAEELARTLVLFTSTFESLLFVPELGVPPTLEA